MRVVSTDPRGTRVACDRLTPLPELHHVLNEQLMVDIWPEMRKPIGELARRKTLNCQYYIRLAMEPATRLDGACCRTSAATSSRAVRATPS